MNLLIMFIYNFLKECIFFDTIYLEKNPFCKSRWDFLCANINEGILSVDEGKILKVKFIEFTRERKN